MIPFFNFYRRYRWTADDFNQLQTSLAQYTQGLFDGLTEGAVVEGLDYASATGLNFTVNVGTAIGPSGSLLAVESSATGTFASPSGGLPARSLVVVRPNLISSNYITNPLSPYNSVPLNTLQGAQVVVIDGTPASSPAYPATQANDVVLFGVRLAAGASSFASSDLDFEVRDILGKNSSFQKNDGRFDDRLRPYRNSNSSVGIKPSQTIGSAPKMFLYMNKSVASIFPKTAGAFTASDTFLNFQTGAITGGDATSAAFTPTIPSAGNSIVATISLTSSDTLQVNFGTQGTYSQCQTKLTNQSSTAGAGALSLPNGVMRVAFVILTSKDGVNITDLDVIDARSTLAFGGPPQTTNAYPNVFLDPNGNGDATDFPSAVALLPASGGVILLVNPITVNTQVSLPANTMVKGRSKNAQITLGVSGGFLTSGAEVIFEDLNFTNTSGAIYPMIDTPYDSMVVERCKFLNATGASGTCVKLRANNCHIGESIFQGVMAPSLGTAIEFALGTTENTEQNNLFTT